MIKLKEIIEKSPTKGELKRMISQIGLNPVEYDLNQVEMGMKVELEHGKKDPKTDVTHNSKIDTLKITLAHLNEKPNYYTLLKKVEND
jgi:hypothetical protein